jgi:hypothetical protein
MRSHLDGTSTGVSTPPNAFDPAFLAQVEDCSEPLTASEADLSGPWKVERVPGHPGTVAVLREWECLEKGDLPAAVFLHPETAALFTTALPLAVRESLFSLGEQEEAMAPVCAGHPITRMFGDQGPQVCGWLRQFHPGLIAVLHVLEGLVRNPRLLAEVNRVAGAGVLRQVGRCLAERLADPEAEGLDD